MIRHDNVAAGQGLRRCPLCGQIACHRRKGDDAMTARSGRHFLQVPGPTNVPDRVLRAIDNPFGSSLLCLARKPA